MDLDKKILIKKREKKDIWQNLYNFPLIESMDKINGEIIIEFLNLIINLNFHLKKYI